MTIDPTRDPQQVRRMFSAVAGRYDLLNRLLSGSLDRRWRAAAARELPADGVDLALDVCGGTGDLSRELLRSGRARQVICCDFAHPMLLRARAKLGGDDLAGRAGVIEADGLRLPFRPASFDAVTVAFGVRNLADMDAGFREFLRVLRPGGVLVVLEFSRPDGALLGPLYRFYLSRVLPRLGDGVSGIRGAYGYLARTIGAFPDAATLAGRIREAGFGACGWQPRSGGIVALHTALK